MSRAGAAWALAMEAADLLAVDPGGLGGATVRAAPGPARDAWLERYRDLVPSSAAWRRMPPQVSESRLLGGIDLAATLNTGCPTAEKGLLAEAHGGVLVVPMAERVAANVVGLLGAALDTGAVAVERDGISRRDAARFSVLLLDEGINDERAPAALMERLAFVLDLEGTRPAAATGTDRVAIASSRARLANVALDAAMLDAICMTALAFGVASLRASSFAVRAARARAAHAARDQVTWEDVEVAVALVIAPRATMMPAVEDDETESKSEPETESGEASEPEAPDATTKGDETTGASQDSTLTDRLIEAARAAIPAGLIEALSAGAGAPARGATAGRAGPPLKSMRRGSPAGVRPGIPRRGERLSLVETLRAAAPWQTLRRTARGHGATRVLIERDDLRIVRFKQRGETTIIFVVDASGSAALNRLAEVKGAIELVLADCYVRRDSVALIAFRGTSADLILPPTRSLARAKRALAGQPGGGGTPLATAIDAATLLAINLRRKGVTPLTVFLTDGRGNIGRSGRAGRSEAEADALAAARTLRAGSFAALLIDIAPRPQPTARQLAQTMGARYQPLPFVEAQSLSQAVLASSNAIVRPHTT